MSSAIGKWFLQSLLVLVVTKHLSMKEVESGACIWHMFITGGRYYPLNGPAIGANFRFSLPQTSFINKAVNNLNLMAEYDSKSINCGFEYSFWKDYINAVVELNRCKYFSGGLVFQNPFKIIKSAHFIGIFQIEFVFFAVRNHKIIFIISSRFVNPFS